MSLKEQLLRFWNFWPPFFFTGIKIEKRSKDYRYIRSRLKLRFWNANFVGTQYGGLIFSMTDPFYMIMLIKNLGHEYTIWDKAASINYLKPGRTDLFAEFILTEDDIQSIRTSLEEQKKMDWLRRIEVKDLQGEVVAKVEKIISISKKN
jgi:5-bromo-4-chloroindolyl phosphate hydrolysis protein